MSKNLEQTIYSVRNHLNQYGFQFSHWLVNDAINLVMSRAENALQVVNWHKFVYKIIQERHLLDIDELDLKQQLQELNLDLASFGRPFQQDNTRSFIEQIIKLVQEQDQQGMAGAIVARQCVLNGNALTNYNIRANAQFDVLEQIDYYAKAAQIAKQITYYSQLSELE